MHVFHTENGVSTVGSFVVPFDQDPKTKVIRMSMKNCAEKLRPANIKRGVPPETPLDALQQRTLRAINVQSMVH